eukprot:744616-Amphidinium_carterae.1
MINRSFHQHFLHVLSGRFACDTHAVKEEDVGMVADPNEESMVTSAQVEADERMVTAHEATGDQALWTPPDLG